MKNLKDIAWIRAGYPFRGRIEEIQDGSVRVIQMRDVDLDRGVNWAGLAATELPGQKEPNYLAPNDLLFVARGNNTYALALDDIPFPTVLSPHFFHLTVQCRSVLPAFLTWQINQEPAQQYFRKSAEGSDILSIRRQVLEHLPIAVPPLDRQEAVIRLDRAWRQEREVMQALTENMSKTMAEIARQLLRGDEIFRIENTE